MTHTMGTAIGVLPLAAANSAKEHAGILPELADGTKEVREMAGCPAVIICSVPGDIRTLWFLHHVSFIYRL